WVGQTPTHTSQPSGQRAGSIFGLPRNRAGADAAITSGITDCPSAKRTASALGSVKFISDSSACGLHSRGVKFLERVLWLLISRQRNVDVTGLDYFKVG